VLHYQRKQLAAQFVRALLGKDALSDAPNGLFLTAPRRTGKSIFLTLDLTPALEQAGVFVLYVDLWAAPRRDPGELISTTIQSALSGFEGLLKKPAKSTGLAKIKIGTSIEFNPGDIEDPKALTLAAALTQIQLAAKAPVALIVDEAQHALTGDCGEAAMTALKSARDQMNRPGDPKLLLIMSGSDRDKLLRLVHTAAAPFYGSQISLMPVLDTGFIDFVSDRIEMQQPSLKPLRREMLQQAFDLFGARPQFFISAIGEALNPISDMPGRPEDAILQASYERQKEDRALMESGYLGLNLVERAVLWRLLERNAKFRPYDADALKFYAAKVGKRVSIGSVQNALEVLRTREPPLVWKSAHGEYAVDDVAMHAWFEYRIAERSWPPMDEAAEGPPKAKRKRRGKRRTGGGRRR
jgi:hypothetical protein